MNKIELKNELERAEVNPKAYSLDGGLPDERYVLSQEPDGRWAVYYSERGQKSGLRYFDNEPTACQYFLEIVIRDPTTRGKW
jgi:hypothetical protein